MLTNKKTETKDTCCNAAEAGRKVRKIIDQTVNGAHDVAKEVEENVRQNPIKASLVAGSIGLLIGTILGRRS
jgi:ElaB/YqjD/DUF883 family membrane-anchored ribosome-binding protein